MNLVNLLLTAALSALCIAALWVGFGSARARRRGETPYPARHRREDLDTDTRPIHTGPYMPGPPWPNLAGQHPERVWATARVPHTLQPRCQGRAAWTVSADTAQDGGAQ